MPSFLELGILCVLLDQLIRLKPIFNQVFNQNNKILLHASEVKNVIKYFMN